MSVLYLYALVPPGASAPSGVGVAGEPLRAVDCGELGAMVGELSEGPQVTAEALRAHDRQVRNIASRVSAVLPARFGTAVADRDELVRLLAPRAHELCNTLRLVENREQMTLRIFGRPSTSGRREESLGPGTAWLRSRAEQLRLPELDSLRRHLEDLVAAERVDRARPGTELMGSVFHLVPRGSAGVYAQRLSEWQGGDLRAVPSGPWPTYAFANEALP